MLVVWWCRVKSDGSDDEDEDVYGSGGGYDYELETAERAGIAAADPAAESTVEGMRDKLQAETEVCKTDGSEKDLQGHVPSSAPVRQCQGYGVGRAHTHQGRSPELGVKRGIQG